MKKPKKKLIVTLCALLLTMVILVPMMSMSVVYANELNSNENRYTVDAILNGDELILDEHEFDDEQKSSDEYPGDDESEDNESEGDESEGDESEGDESEGDESEDDESEDDESEDDEFEDINPDLIVEYPVKAPEIRADLISAIDDSPFTAIFDPMTGKISMYDMNEEPMGYRYVEDEAAFWGLVAVNAEVTSMTLDQHFEAARINRNVTSIDVEAMMLINYDEHGTMTETPLDLEYRDIHRSSRAFTKQFEQFNNRLESFSMEPRFNTGSVWMHVPFANMPHSGSLVGGRFHNTTSSHGSVELWTYDFPSGMRTIDVFFTNAIGDCRTTHLDIRAWREVEHKLGYPGEPYGARVSSYDGSFSNVQLRFFANIAAPPPNAIIRNPPQNGMTFNMQNLYVSWDPIPGAIYDVILDDVTAGRFVNSWHTGSTANFTIPQSNFIAGRQYSVSVAAEVGNQSSWSSRTFFIGNQSNVTLTFNGNGGSPSSQTLTRTAGTTMGTMPTQPTRSDHIFAGWFNTSALTGGTEFTSSSTVPNSSTTYWARWARNVDVRLYYDTGRLGSGQSAHIRSAALAARRPFMNSFYLDLIIPSSVTTGTFLKNECAHSSILSSPHICTINACNGLSWNSNMPAFTSDCCLHHSSAELLLGQATDLGFNSGLVTLFTPGNLCAFARDENTGIRTNTHITNILGIAPWRNFASSNNRGNVAIIGFSGNHWRDVRVIQHEWSHNYGTRDHAVHGLCVNNQPCIMKGSTTFADGFIENIWCDNCFSTIQSNRTIH